MPIRVLALLLALTSQAWRGSGVRAEPTPARNCPPSEQILPVPPPLNPPAPLSAAGSPAEGPPASDYRHRLRSTHLGWPRRDHWCVWIEPGAVEGPAARWDGRWRQAVDAALGSWSSLLAITVVEAPEQAQIQVLRRRPPLRGGRASHGRAELQLLQVRRAGRWQLEPQVVVSLSPGQRLEATEATALHELGHAFGLWGHSEEATDAMAAVPGARPVRELSARDRATLQWLQAQPGLSRQTGAAAAPPSEPAERPATAGSPRTVLRGD